MSDKRTYEDKGNLPAALEDDWTVATPVQSTAARTAALETLTVRERAFRAVLLEARDSLRARREPSRLAPLQEELYRLEVAFRSCYFSMSGLDSATHERLGRLLEGSRGINAALAARLTDR
jgi:hypothetical protein